MITYVIPTYERVTYLERLLDFFALKELPYEIWIADSSRPFVSAQNQKIIDSFSKRLKVRYENYPVSISVFRKLSETLAKVETEFVVVCADDDFQLPTSVEKCAQFLKENPDYSLAQGIGYGFRLINAKSDGNGALRVLWNQAGHDLSQDSALKRLASHLENYRPTFYGAHRTKQLAESMSKAEKMTTGGGFGEILTSCLTVIQGKVKRFRIPFEIRDCQSLEDPLTTRSWSEVLVGEDFTERYLLFRKHLVEAILKSSSETEGAVTAEIKRIMSKYLIKCFNNNQSFEKEDINRYPASHLVRLLIKRVPIVGPILVSIRETMKIKPQDVMLETFLNDSELSFLRNHILRYARKIYENELLSKAKPS
jgi:glycosyltransferase domain-containing protein